MMRLFQLVVVGCLAATFHAPVSAGEQWSKAKAAAWQASTPWLVGCNFSPSTAINQLEMWQADTFDLATIDRELGWAQELGFNSIRVFLHDLPWKDDPSGFLERIDKFLTVADKHKIGVVLRALRRRLGSVPEVGQAAAAEAGPAQLRLGAEPWPRNPDTSPTVDELEGYVKGVVGRFKDDKRVHAWDLFNEPDNRNQSSYGKHEPANKEELSLGLLPRRSSPGQGPWIPSSR